MVNSIYGEHDGAIYNSMRHSIAKSVIYFLNAYLQISLFAVATL